MPILNALKAFLFPRRCMLCRTFLEKDETDLCDSCRKNVPEYPYGADNPAPGGKITLHFLDSFTAVWYYDKDVRKSILRYKFRNGTHLAPKFGRILGQKLLAHGPQNIDMITWVPVSSQRKRKRGYDQSELLAQYAGLELGMQPVRLLNKIRHTPPQSRLSSPEARKANVSGAYQVVKESDISGKVILLLDDVYTTGATTEECARVLLTSGAKSIHCAAIAAHHHKKPSR